MFESLILFTLSSNLSFLLTIVISFNPLPDNVALMKKPGGWFLLAKYAKNRCGRVTFNVKMQVDDVSLPEMFFTHFASKNHISGFSISGTLGRYDIRNKANILGIRPVLS